MNFSKNLHLICIQITTQFWHLSENIKNTQLKNLTGLKLRENSNMSYTLPPQGKCLQINN